MFPSVRGVTPQKGVLLAGWAHNAHGINTINKGKDVQDTYDDDDLLTEQKFIRRGSQYRLPRLSLLPR